MPAVRHMTFGRYDYAAFLTFFAYASGSIVVPVALVILARDLGFSLESGGMTAGGALQLGRTVPMVGTMLLCGFAAGRWGTRSRSRQRCCSGSASPCWYPSGSP